MTLRTGNVSLHVLASGFMISRVSLLAVVDAPREGIGVKNLQGSATGRIGSAVMRALGLFLAAAAISGSACAMNSASHRGLRCTVEGEEKLPSELGGQAAVCEAISRAALPQLQGAGITPDAVVVQVSVKSKYMFSAVVSVNGVPRAEQTVGVSDRALNQRAVQMLAQAVAGELAK